MPRLKSAIKRVKTSERNRIHNLFYKTQIKTVLKKVSDLVAKKDTKLAQTAANEAFALIDQASSKNIIHKNNAAKKKSRISKWLKILGPTSSSKKP